MLSAADKIWERTEITDSGCWEWRGATNAAGYGRVTVDGATQTAHRVSWRIFRGAIPDGLTIDHLCRNKPCLNPDHLEPVTLAENIRRSVPGALLRLDACPSGHLWTDATTYVASSDNRQCRICNARAVARYQARKRLAK